MVSVWPIALSHELQGETPTDAHLPHSQADAALAAADGQQAAMMAERVILVDNNDVVIGHASKKECACLAQLRSVGMPHTSLHPARRPQHMC